MQEEIKLVPNSVDRIVEGLKACKEKICEELTSMGLKLAGAEQLTRKNSNKITDNTLRH